MEKQTYFINGQSVTIYMYGTGEPLLFLHGGRVEARTFKGLIKHLGKRYRVIAPDVPGYGSSPTPKDEWSFADYAAFFDLLLGKLDLSKVTVVGYSMGGGIALNLAANSARISNLVLIDASGLTEAQAERSRHHDGRRLWFYMTHPQYISTLGILLRDYGLFLWSHRKDYDQLRMIRIKCRQLSNDEAIRRITVPTSIIWGKDDWIYPLEVAYESQRNIPNSELHIVEGNHDWLLYTPLRLKFSML
jgi:pimeloyl-ACP methyl ester carboxylesterase